MPRLNCLRQCKSSPLGSNIVKFVSFFFSFRWLQSSYFKMGGGGTGWACEYRTILWAIDSPQASPDHPRSLIHRAPDNGRKAPHCPKNFCWCVHYFVRTSAGFVLHDLKSWKVFLGLLFFKIFICFLNLHAILTHLHSQKKKERSSVYMLKLHLFYSQLYKSCS